MRQLKVRALIKGVSYGFIVLIIGYGALFLWVVTGTGKLYYLTAYLKLIAFTAVAVAGLMGGMTARWQGWKHGGWIGLILSACTLAFGGIMVPQLNSMGYIMTKLLYGAFIGGAAAVCGVNLSFVRRRKRFSKKINNNSLY